MIKSGQLNYSSTLRSRELYRWNWVILEEKEKKKKIGDLIDLLGGEVLLTIILSLNQEAKEEGEELENVVEYNFYSWILLIFFGFSTVEGKR